MATTQQTEANRQNAQKSTGPRSPEGKAVSRFNALKSGIDAESHVIPGEDSAKLETLVAEYRERFDTSAPECRMLVDTMIACEWQARRLIRAEASFWRYEASRTESSFASNDHPEGRVVFFGDKVFDRLQRRVNAVQRNWERALKQLKSLQDSAAEAVQPPETPAPPPDPPATTPPDPAPPPSNQQPIPQIGFVPQILVEKLEQAEKVGQALPPANIGTLPA
jgi:hypothetical protein